MNFFDILKNGPAQARLKINNHQGRSKWVFKVAPRTTEYCPVVGFFKLRKCVDLGPKNYYIWRTHGNFP